jgi:hypothetical protein
LFAIASPAHFGRLGAPPTRSIDDRRQARLEKDIMIKIATTGRLDSKKTP